MRSIIFKTIIITVLNISLILMYGCSSDDNSTNPNDPNDPNTPVNTVTDIDGNIYKTVTIGNQTWMAENLKVIHYRNGESIPNIMDDTWDNQKIGAYCNYNNDAHNGDNMGRLYNVYVALDIRNIAPVGWHVPNDSEWQILIASLGGDHVAGGKLKEVGTTNWSTPNTGATDESGFTALPVGVRGSGGVTNDFFRIGYWNYFWTSTLDSISLAGYYRPEYYYRFLTHDSKSIFGSTTTVRETNGYSIRCVKD